MEITTGCALAAEHNKLSGNGFRRPAAARAWLFAAPPGTAGCCAPRSRQRWLAASGTQTSAEAHGGLERQIVVVAAVRTFRVLHDCRAVKERSQSWPGPNQTCGRGPRLPAVHPTANAARDSSVVWHVARLPPISSPAAAPRLGPISPSHRSGAAKPWQEQRWHFAMSTGWLAQLSGLQPSSVPSAQASGTHQVQLLGCVARHLELGGEACKLVGPQVDGL